MYIGEDLWDSCGDCFLFYGVFQLQAVSTHLINHMYIFALLTMFFMLVVSVLSGCMCSLHLENLIKSKAKRSCFDH